jgi:hypothetical protein
MAYVSYKTKRALGAKYSRPPEIEMEEKRLEQQYAMIPQMAQIRESKRQANMAMLDRTRTREAQEKMATQSGIMGTVGNVASLGMQAYKAGLFDKAPSVAKTALSLPYSNTAINPAVSGITGMAQNGQYVTPAINAAQEGVGMFGSAAEAGMDAAMEAGADITGSIVPNAVGEASTGIFGGLSSAATAVAPYMQIHAAREIGQNLAGGAFNEAGRTMKSWGGVNAQAGEAMQSFLGEPVRTSANLEDVPEKIIDNVLPEGSNLSTENNWQLKTITDIFNPVGTGLEWLKKGLASGIGGLIESIF